MNQKILYYCQAGPRRNATRLRSNVYWKLQTLKTAALLQFSTQYLISTAILDISDYISGIHKLNLLTTL